MSPTAVAMIPETRPKQRTDEPAAATSLAASTRARSGVGQVGEGGGGSGGTRRW